MFEARQGSPGSGEYHGYPLEPTQRVRGDRVNVRFRFGWVDAGPSPDVLARSTMATLSIEAGGATVTSVLDRRNRIFSDEIVVPLFSIAEWLITNWWHIWCEIDDTSEQRPEFESRHNLAFAGDGFVLPSLTMTPTVGRMHVQWTRYKPRYARIEFVDEGRESIEREDLELEFRNLIDAVLERLHGRPETGAAADNLGRAWNAVNDLDPDEREFSRAAALLGIDPFDVQEHVADDIVTFWERVDPFLREDALATATEGSLANVGAWLENTLQTLSEDEHDDDWSDLRRTLPPLPTAEPWIRGYALARAARDRIGADGGPFNFAPQGPLAIHHHETQPPSARIHGLVAADTPACMTLPRGESGRRFLIARALGDYLDRSAPGPGLLSSLATDRQAQSRAFAAEFLAPAESLRRRIIGTSVEAERTDDLAREFGVASELIRRQIQNHDLATVVDY